MQKRKTNILLSALVGILVLSAKATAQDPYWIARHKEDDKEWATRTGLKPETVRKLRLAIGVTDDDEAIIDEIDMKGLRARNHIFLADAGGNGHCLGLYVLARHRASFVKVWSAVDKGFCRQSPGNPHAYVTADGKIKVKIDIEDDKLMLANKETLYVTYAWNGKTYKYRGDKKVRNRNPDRLIIVPDSSLNKRTARGKAVAQATKM